MEENTGPAHDLQPGVNITQYIKVLRFRDTRKTAIPVSSLEDAKEIVTMLNLGMGLQVPRTHGASVTSEAVRHLLSAERPLHHSAHRRSRHRGRKESSLTHADFPMAIPMCTGSSRGRRATCVGGQGPSLTAALFLGLEKAFPILPAPIQGAESPMPFTCWYLWSAGQLPPHPFDLLVQLFLTVPTPSSPPFRSFLKMTVSHTTLLRRRGMRGQSGDHGAQPNAQHLRQRV